MLYMPHTLAVWSVCLKWNIRPSRLPEASANTKKALIVFQALLMKMWKHLPLSVGGRSRLSACSECSKPWVPTQTRQIMMMEMLTKETEMIPRLVLIGSLPVVTAQAHRCQGEVSVPVAAAGKAVAMQFNNLKVLW